MSPSCCVPPLLFPINSHWSTVHHLLVSSTVLLTSFSFVHYICFVLVLQILAIVLSALQLASVCLVGDIGSCLKLNVQLSILSEHNSHSLLSIHSHSSL